MVYQINSSSLFLTYPQCPLDKQVVYDYLLNLFRPERMVVAHELHHNGDHHLHAYLKLTEPYRTRDPHFADIQGYHGNYQGCRSAKNVIKYCTKEEDFISNFDITDTNNRKRLFDEVIKGQRTLVSLIEELPHLLKGYKNLKADYTEFLQDKSQLRPSLPQFIPNPWGKVMFSHRRSKKRHYWIYSTRPSVGKTTKFAEPLVETFRGQLTSNRELYWNLSGNEEFIIIDEYQDPKYKIGELNSMCDGSYGYRIFQGGVIKLDKPLIFILSNKSISDVYTNQYELLHARFNEIQL